MADDDELEDYSCRLGPSPVGNVTVVVVAAKLKPVPGQFDDARLRVEAALAGYEQAVREAVIWYDAWRERNRA